MYIGEFWPPFIRAMLFQLSYQNHDDRYQNYKSQITIDVIKATSTTANQNNNKNNKPKQLYMYTPKQTKTTTNQNKKPKQPKQQLLSINQNNYKPRQQLQTKPQQIKTTASQFLLPFLSSFYLLLFPPPLPLPSHLTDSRYGRWNDESIICQRDSSAH